MLGFLRMVTTGVAAPATASGVGVGVGFERPQPASAKSSMTRMVRPNRKPMVRCATNMLIPPSLLLLERNRCHVCDLEDNTAKDSIPTQVVASAHGIRHGSPINNDQCY